MGLLTLGTPLSWPETKALSSHVREHGITQLLSLWSKVKGRRGDAVLWGDEIEYIVVSFDEATKNPRLSLRQGEILKVLAVSHERSCQEVEAEDEEGQGGSGASRADQIPTFHPEYGRYMLESTPGCPFGASPAQLCSVEGNMRMRRRIAKRHLLPNELPLTLTSFPRLGVTDVPFLDDETLVPNGKASQSLFLPDEIINQHVRFPTLTANIRSRRGSKVAINLPIYKDVNTPSPFVDPSIPWDRKLFPGDSEAKDGAAKVDHIYMDSMGFGMGCCCLQVTFQACSVTEARATYDQLVPVTPLLLALSAASPAYRGYLADVDARWSVISGAVDDRTPHERGEDACEGKVNGAGEQAGPSGNTSCRMYKSRYDSVSSYLSLSPLSRPEVYNDVPLPIHQPTYERLMAPVEEGGGGMDALLARHFAHLFTRDPLVIFSERIDQDDEDSMDHFENIQSTNWQTMRFKPPPPNSDIGWRVEVRSMEVQVTDFENAAFSVFVVLLTRAILRFGLNFYIPISKVDENMHKAQKRNAVLTEKFAFRKDVMGAGRERRGATKEAQPQTQDNVGSSAVRSSSTAPRTQPKVMYGVNSTWTTPSSSRAASPAKLPMGTGKTAPNGHSASSSIDIEDEYTEFTIDELINGTTAARQREAERSGSPSASSSSAGNVDFPGLLTLVHDYLDSLPAPAHGNSTTGSTGTGTGLSHSRSELNLYLSLISHRASGKLVTAATYIRSFIRSHPEYNGDSFISKEVCFDLVKHLDAVEKGEVKAEEFLPAGYAERRKELERRECAGRHGPAGPEGTGSDSRGGMKDAAAEAERVLRSEQQDVAAQQPQQTSSGSPAPPSLEERSAKGGAQGTSVRSGDRMKEEKDELLGPGVRVGAAAGAGAGQR